MSKRRGPIELKDVEMQRLRRAWEQAREGKPGAKELLLKVLLAHKSVDSFVRHWTVLKTMPLPKKSEEEILDDLVMQSLREKSPPTAWSRAEAFISGSPKPVSGGLPSLGKRTK
ncbi:hypothetical protein MTR80_06170 [Alcaligenes aquatilis]|uniref:Uncharacterized protein n=1 Tax=Alcaligenes aquatilis TaxID=323284 RepID=A0ABY4NJX0_9BURK|nr:hypothetical protein [Alcaligenes aquatilis]UQN37287.1 hypothetical protein MTR80_06170 [Alcaligenes aquatilis]